MAKDYYAILGVRRDANQDRIKAAYHVRAKEWHPDRNKKPEAAERFRDIAEAYEVLGDPEKRARYDRGETDAVPPLDVRAANLLSSVVEYLIEAHADAIGKVDIMAKMKAELDQLARDAAAVAAQATPLRKRLAAFEIALKRAKRKNPAAVDFITVVARRRIAELTHQIALIDAESADKMTTVKAARDLFNAGGWTYEVDSGTPSPSTGAGYEAMIKSLMGSAKL